MRELLRAAAKGSATILIGAFLTFSLFPLAPGDYFTGEELTPGVKVQTVETWRRALLRSDESVAKSFGQWLASCAEGSCGTSIAYSLPVLPLIRERVPATVWVWIPAWLLATVIGFFAALALPRKLCLAIEPLAAALTGIPEVLTAAMLLWLAVWVHAPATGIVLVQLAVALPLFWIVFLHSASAAEHTRRQAYYDVAAGRGMGRWKLWWWYLAPGCAAPLLGLSAPLLVSAAGMTMVAEAMLGWPGVGGLFVEAIRGRDYPVIQGTVMLVAVVLVCAQIGADAVHRWIDPRVTPR